MQRQGTGHRAKSSERSRLRGASMNQQRPPNPEDLAKNLVQPEILVSRHSDEFKKAGYCSGTFQDSAAQQDKRDSLDEQEAHEDRFADPHAIKSS